MKKKMLLIIGTILMIAFMLPLTGLAEDAVPPAYNQGVINPAPTVEVPAPAPATKEAAPAAATALQDIAESIKLIPNAAQVHYNIVLLLKDGDVGHGPAYDLARFYNVVYLQAQWAKVFNHDGGSFAGLGAQAKIVDIIKACHGDPLDFLVSVNPGIGIIGGYKFAASDDTHSGFDGGFTFTLANVDLEKIANLIGKLF